MAPIIGFNQHPNPFNYSFKDLGKEIVRQGTQLLNEGNIEEEIKSAHDTAKNKGLLAGGIALGGVAVATIGSGARFGGSVGGGQGAITGGLTGAVLIAGAITLYAPHPNGSDRNRARADADRILGSLGRSSSPQPNPFPPAPNGSGGLPDLTQLPILIGAATIVDNMIDGFTETAQPRPAHTTEIPTMIPSNTPTHMTETPSETTSTPDQWTSIPHITEANGTMEIPPMDHPAISPRVDQTTPTPSEIDPMSTPETPSLESIDVHGDYLNQTGTGIDSLTTTTTPSASSDSSDAYRRYRELIERDNRRARKFIDSPHNEGYPWDWDDAVDEPEIAPKSTPDSTPKNSSEPPQTSQPKSPADLEPVEDIDPNPFDPSFDSGGLKDLVDELGNLGDPWRLDADRSVDEGIDSTTTPTSPNTPNPWTSDPDDSIDMMPERSRPAPDSTPPPQNKPKVTDAREVENIRIKIDALQAEHDQLHRIWRPDKPQYGRGIRGNEEEYQAAVNRMDEINRTIKELLDSIQ